MNKLWILLLFFMPLWADSPDVEACRKEVVSIEKQIQKLETEKQKHVVLAGKYQKEGDQWQYNTGRIQDAHASWAKADHERIQIGQIQRQIDLLNDRKNHIFQIYPQLWQP